MLYSTDTGKTGLPSREINNEASMKSTPPRKGLQIAAIMFVAVLLPTGRLGGQAANPASSTSPASPAHATAPSTSLPVIKATTHLVTVDVVATDHRGNIVSDLTTKDFQVFEQIPGKKGQREQKISQFEFVTQASAAKVAKQGMKMPAGVYTNLVSARRLPVPPTVLLCVR